VSHYHIENTAVIKGTGLAWHLC